MAFQLQLSNDFWHKTFSWQFFVCFFLLSFSPFVIFQYAFAVQQGKVFSVRQPPSSLEI